MNIKQRYQKFKQWQLDPLQFSYDKSKTHHCACCGEDFKGNFCPACGQRLAIDSIVNNSNNCRADTA